MDKKQLTTNKDLVEMLTARNENGKYDHIIEKAFNYSYHEWKGEEPTKMRLMDDIAPFPELEDIRQMVINGDFDEPMDEEDKKNMGGFMEEFYEGIGKGMVIDAEKKNIDEAKEKINQVLKDHNLLGVSLIFGLHAGGSLFSLDRDYSCLTTEGTPPGMEGFRAKSRLQEDFNGDQQAQLKMYKQTVAVLNQMTFLTGNFCLMGGDYIKLIEEKIQYLEQEIERKQAGN